MSQNLQCHPLFLGVEGDVAEVEEFEDSREARQALVKPETSSGVIGGAAQ